MVLHTLKMNWQSLMSQIIKISYMIKRNSFWINFLRITTIILHLIMMNSTILYILMSVNMLIMIQNKIVKILTKESCKKVYTHLLLNIGIS